MNNLNFFSKIKFLYEKPKVIIVLGEDKKITGEVISQILKKRFLIGKDVLIFDNELKNINKLNFLIKNSSLPILVVTGAGNNNFDKVQVLSKIMPSQGFLLLNFDDEKMREFKKESPSNRLTFGFREGADFQATDVRLNHGINFKVNYKGNIVPVWLEKIFGQERIYPVLAGISTGVILDLNLIEIFETLKNFKAESIDNCNKKS